jgi:hypothetical protein
MKKNLLKLGALAVALVVLFAACAQPTDETKSDSSRDVILRILLDRPEKQTLDTGDRFQIRVGQNLAVPAYLEEEAPVVFKTTTPVVIDHATGRALEVGGAAATAALGSAPPTATLYPANNTTGYELKRRVWKPTDRKANDGAGGSNNKSYIPMNRARTAAYPSLVGLPGTPVNPNAPGAAPAIIPATNASNLFANWMDSKLRLAKKSYFAGTNLTIYANLTASVVAAAPYNGTGIPGLPVIETYSALNSTPQLAGALLPHDGGRTGFTAALGLVGGVAGAPAATDPTPYVYTTGAPAAAAQRVWIGTDGLTQASIDALPAGGGTQAADGQKGGDAVKMEIYWRESKVYEAGGAFISRALAQTDWWARALASYPAVASHINPLNDIHTILEDRIPTAKYFETGVVRITSGVMATNQDPANPAVGNNAAGTNTIPGLDITADLGGVPKVVTTNSQYYVDVVLIDKTPAAKTYGETLKKSFSGYVELEILPSTPYVDGNGDIKGLGVAPSPATPQWPATWGGMDGTFYFMYTKDRHGYNRWDTAEGKWQTSNENVKKLSLKPGINEVRLSYFSQGEGDVEFK